MLPPPENKTKNECKGIVPEGVGCETKCNEEKLFLQTHPAAADSRRVQLASNLFRGWILAGLEVRSSNRASQMAWFVRVRRQQTFHMSTIERFLAYRQGTEAVRNKTTIRQLQEET